MIKIFTLFNVAGLFLFNLLFVGDVSITQDMPAKMEAGTEIKVSVTINKDQISGFAKLQIDLPPGMTATAIETKGASFTFAEGKAKFIWMALPAQPSFKVSYTLSADASTSGSLPVTGRLSYIQDNERKTVDMAPSTITVSGGAAVASSPAAQQAATAADAPVAQDAGTPALDHPAAAAAATMATADLSTQDGVGNVSATRTVTTISPTEMLVEVTVKKGMLRGFGKLQENLPEGFTAVAKENDDAIFTAKGRVAKFVWLNLPSKSEVTVSYRLLAPASASGDYTVNGEFGYLMNDLTQRAVVGLTTFTVNASSIAQTKPETAPVKTEPLASTTPATKPPVTTPPVTAKPAPETVTAQTSKPKVTSMPAPESGITYKVQITAAHREVGKPYFVQRHHYEGDFSIERNDGWIKYVTGMFDRYKAARDQRQAYIDANYNFPGPFVTAYNNGERITVQEALMIAKQRSAQ